MPLYEYLCGSCGHRFERIQKFSDAPIGQCPSCGAAEVEKLISSPAIQFKGTGWYITDYAKSGKPAGPAAASDGSAKGDKPASSESPSSDAAAKPATSPSESSSGTTAAPAKA